MNIVINNPAARSGGALTILGIYFDKAKIDKENNYFFFVSTDYFKEFASKNITIVNVGAQNKLQRILWDKFLLNHKIKKLGIIPHKVISLQNTPVYISGNVEQIVYYHQPLSLVDKRWNILKREEILFWFYANIYPFFIKNGLKRVDRVIVQTEWVREAFSKKFNFDIEKINVEKPLVNKIDVTSVNSIHKNCFRMFYPATPLKYKNHNVIVEWLSRVSGDFDCIFTFDAQDNTSLYNQVVKYGLVDKIKFVGSLSYDRVLEYYKSSDLLLFPSDIETLGLPLIEAMQFNLSIIAADKEYAREVLIEYDDVTFVETNGRGVLLASEIINNKMELFESVTRDDYSLGN